MHRDLRALAQQARPQAAPAPGFATADSSGYVDLSAYSSDDDSWIERELARARVGARDLSPPTPLSMAPMAIDAPNATMSIQAFRERPWLYSTFAAAAVACVATLAVAIGRNAPPPHGASATQAAAVAPVLPTAPAPVAPAVQTIPTADAVMPIAPIEVKTKDTLPPAARERHVPAWARTIHFRTTPPVAASPAPVVAQRPAATPAPSHASSSGDSLMDLIRASVKKN